VPLPTRRDTPLRNTIGHDPMTKGIQTGKGGKRGGEVETKTRRRKRIASPRKKNLQLGAFYLGPGQGGSHHKNPTKGIEGKGFG